MSDQVGEIARRRRRHDRAVTGLAWASVLSWVAVIVSLIASVWTADMRWLWTATIMLFVGIAFLLCFSSMKEKKP